VAKLDPQVLAHLEWLGFVQPKGLVVSAPALVRAGAILDRRDVEGQRLLRASVGIAPSPADAAPDRRAERRDENSRPRIRDFRSFAAQVLGWTFSASGYAGTAEQPIPEELQVAIPDARETLRPDFAVREPAPQSGAPVWQLVVRVIEAGDDFDRVPTGGGRLELSHHSRMERLLRETGVPAGLLVNGDTLRLISAPRGESSGWIDFQVVQMVQTAGRPICTALRLLLSEQRLLALPRHQRLAALLADSRKFQNEVSERLAEQVLHALYELLRGFQSAHDASGGTLLRAVLADHPDEVYRALLTVILRLVFILYAEERDLLPENDTFIRYYSVAGLHERLREDAALFPDTMEQRFGAWAQLVALFRMIHDGARSPGMRLPARHGVLFDPDRFPFLEARPRVGGRQLHERITPPLVPDGTVYRALEKLLVLDGERISYRALDVEQIGSVYETMMGFRLETASGRSVAIKAHKKQGAPTTVTLDELVAEGPGKRAKWIQDRTDRKLTERVRLKVADAATLDDLHAALGSVIDKEATPDVVPRGAMVLQPSEERRRSGSHYTPRELTEPIVRTTLEPILARLREADGRPPKPEQILDLKVCDPAMGPGAFLVEACRYLGDALVESWRAHDAVPAIPADEDEVVLARRLVAQRCLYGVDRNPVAVDLAKMSLWLVTLAKDHPLTFLDHALRHGDSLVGLSRRQLEAFHWDASKPPMLAGLGLRDSLDKVLALRARIREAGDDIPDWELRDLWDQAQFELSKVRLFGDLAVASYFQAEKPKDRERKRAEFAQAAMRGEAHQYESWLEERRHDDPPLAPFHWEIEFPEVFERVNPGFDAFVGNPPFMGGRNLTAAQGSVYSGWLLQQHDGSSGGADLVAHFFRRAFDLLRQGGAFGLIATNTIAQGDTRASGLRWICNHQGDIFAVRRRVKWPGMAAVVVSVIHAMKGAYAGLRTLDDLEVDRVTAFLFHRGGHGDPIRLASNADKSFQGSIILGMGFTFDDTDAKGVATPLFEMRRLLERNPHNREVIFPYIGGEEVNTSPTHEHHRCVINFGERTEAECRAFWPELMAIVEAKVKPYRIDKDSEKYPRMVHEWWKYWNARRELYTAISGLERVLALSRVGQAMAFAFLPSTMIYADSLIAFPFSTHAAFCALQARPHELWARFFASSMKDDLRYTPSDCFETFPFPDNWETDAALEAAGKAYYELRAALMVRNNEGLTKTYNRFHDPVERNLDIVKLRELHAAMDRAVLDAYGWSDIHPVCEFLLDYEIEEEEYANRKKPYRYRWPDDIHDEVLARLLELNAQRARAEALVGAAAEKGAGKKRPSRRAPAARSSPELFE